MTEKTLCIIKPDAVENDYVEKINEMISMENINIINIIFNITVIHHFSYVFSIANDTVAKFLRRKIR